MNKILIIGNIYFRNELSGVSGTEIRLGEIVEKWSIAGHEIHFWGGKAGQELMERYNVKFKYYPGFTMNNDDQKLIRYIQYIPKLIKLPKELENFEGLIYTPTEMLTNILPAIQLKRNQHSKVRWGCVVHWLPPLLWWKRRRSNFLASFMFMLYERIGVFLAKHYADVLLPVSEGTANQLRRINVPENKIQTVSCGVNLAIVASIPDQPKMYEAIFIKRLQQTKGVFDLIDIWKRVVQKIPNAKLIILGTGPAKGQFQKMIEQNNLHNNIILKGLILDEKLKCAEFKKSKLLILPSYEENWAIVMGEAMAAGLPVIAYQLKELDIVWLDNYIKVPLSDTQIFSDKIIEFLADGKKQKEFGDKGRQYVQKYDWQTIANRELTAING